MGILKLKQLLCCADNSIFSVHGSNPEKLIDADDKTLSPYFFFSFLISGPEFQIMRGGWKNGWTEYGPELFVSQV